jgi:hypothetical protein
LHPTQQLALPPDSAGWITCFALWRSFVDAAVPRLSFGRSFSRLRRSAVILRQVLIACARIAPARTLIMLIGKIQSNHSQESLIKPFDMLPDNG